MKRGSIICFTRLLSDKKKKKKVVPKLVWDNPTCLRATKPVWNYWAWALEPGSCIKRSHLLLLPPIPPTFPMSQLFAWGGQSIGVSASASVLPMSTQDWSPLGCTGWISLQSKGLSRVFSKNTVQKHQFFSAQLSSQSNSHPYLTTGKTIALTRRTFVGKVISLLFNMLSRFLFYKKLVKISAQKGYRTLRPK